MRVKLQHNLQPSEHPAHSVVIEDDNGVPILAALQFDNYVLCSKAGDDDFHAVLNAMGINKKVIVEDFVPKPVNQVVREF